MIYYLDIVVFLQLMSHATMCYFGSFANQLLRHKPKSQAKSLTATKTQGQRPLNQFKIHLVFCQHGTSLLYQDVYLGFRVAHHSLCT